LGSEEAVLSVTNLCGGYGAAKVIRGIGFSIARGEVLAVIGRNGVGKTTLVETICGLTTYHDGEITLYGERIETLPPYRRNRLGIGWVPQEREVFSSLTVHENIEVVARPGEWTMARIFELFPRLAARRGNYGNQLSGGEQQMLAIARALATNPTLLLLDEPIEGLAPLVIQELIAAIDRVRTHGDLSILMVEQKHEIALAHSDRCIVMDRGEIVYSCESKLLLRDQATLERFVGVAE
jgi:branched-chain amino acid transport system ATP-binding protein